MHPTARLASTQVTTVWANPAGAASHPPAVPIKYRARDTTVPSLVSSAMPPPYLDTVHRAAIWRLNVILGQSVVLLLRSLGVLNVSSP